MLQTSLTIAVAQVVKQVFSFLCSLPFSLISWFKFWIISASSCRPWKESRWTAFNQSCSTSTQWVRVWSRAPPSTLTPRHWSTTWRPPTSNGTHSTSRCVQPVTVVSHTNYILHPLCFMKPPVLTSGCGAHCPAAGGSVALWQIPGCSGAAAQLAERHRGAGGQSEASVCRVPRSQGPDPRTKGTGRIKQHNIKASFSCKNRIDEKLFYLFRNNIKAKLRDFL